MSEATPEPNLINNLVTGVVVGIGTLAWIAQRFFSKAEAGGTTHDRLLLERGDSIDAKAFKDSLDRQEAFLKRIAENSDSSLGLERKRIEQEELIRVRAEERIRAQEDETRKALNDRLMRIAEAEERKRHGRQHDQDHD